MSLVTIRKISREELVAERLMLTGEAAARVKPGMDRRTFKAWAKRAGVEPAFLLVDGREAFYEADVEKVAKFFRNAKGKVPNK